MSEKDAAKARPDVTETPLRVVATRRLQRHLLEQPARDPRNKQQVWATPGVLTWNDWLAQVWRQLRYNHRGADAPLPMLLNPAQEAVLWEQQIRSAQDDLLNLHATSRSAANSWQLLNDYGLDMERWPQPDEDVKIWRHWAQGLARRCRDQGWITYAELPARLLQELQAGRWQPPAAISFAGFIVPTPAQRRLWQAMEQSGCTVQLHTERCVRSESSQAPCQDPLDELVKAARWARALLKAGADGPIGVVVRDLASLRDDAVAIFHSILEPSSGLSGLPRQPAVFHISLGRPLANHPVVADALCLLRWYQHPLPITTIARLLRSPFIRGDDTERVARANLDSELRERGWHEISVAALRTWLQQRQQCPQLLRSLQQALELQSKPSRQSPGEWASVFTEWLNCFSWPGPRELNSAEHQTVMTWRETLSRFAGTCLVTPTLSKKQAMNRLARMARQQIYQPLADPAPVQVMGLAEAQGLRFSHLWIAGMSEDEWPPAPRPDPFLPVRVQRQAGVPNATAESALQQARVITEDLLGAADSIVISYPRQKLEQQLRVSPLFADTKLQDPKQSEFAGTAHWLLENNKPLEYLQDQYGPPVEEHEQLRGGAGLFQDQALCPFRAFARRRLHARGTPVVDPGISPAEHGKLIHACLARLWQNWQTQQALLSMSESESDAAVNEVVDTLLRDEVLSRSAFSDALWRVQRQRLIDLLKEWLQVERERPEFSVLAVEQMLTAEYGGIRVRLQLDRIDATENGQLVVDFKTGAKISVKRWFDDRPEQPQLPLYALAATPPVQGIAFAWVRRGACELTGVSESDMAIAGVKAVAEQPHAWSAQLQHWQHAIESISQEIRAGWAQVAPKSAAACQTCDLQGLCRVYELADMRKNGDEQ